MSNSSRVIYTALALLVIASDQATKHLIARTIPRGTTIPVIHGCFNLVDTRNAGIAFSLFADSPSPFKTALLIVLSIALLAGVVFFVVRSGPLEWRSNLGLSLIFGGAASNLLDRLRTGRVVDFLDFYIRGHHWPAFNLADSAIVVGAALLILQMLRSERRRHA